VEPRSPENSRTPVARRRRNRTRQRQRLLAALRATAAHPTAAELHAALLPELPQLSLATVYRNLEVLVSEGQVEPVASQAPRRAQRAGGERSLSGPALRYDANLEPHHHFNCEACGRIQDVEFTPPRHLLVRLRRDHALEASRVRIDFYGLCTDCRAEAGTPTSHRGDPKSHG
jgi:Fe2+ or Zn2+ uptake regulation protein